MSTRTQSPPLLERRRTEVEEEAGGADGHDRPEKRDEGNDEPASAEGETRIDRKIGYRGRCKSQISE